MTPNPENTILFNADKLQDQKKHYNKKQCILQIQHCLTQKLLHMGPTHSMADRTRVENLLRYKTKFLYMIPIKCQGRGRDHTGE